MPHASAEFVAKFHKARHVKQAIDLEIGQIHADIARYAKELAFLEEEIKREQDVAKGIEEHFHEQEKIMSEGKPCPVSS
jgi:predicted DNA-binding protein YlxM (UPF0122 family)